jgi:regulator of protease activity HflC (stomatin/prohibitin superfamily)
MSLVDLECYLLALREDIDSALDDSDDYRISSLLVEANMQTIKLDGIQLKRVLGPSNIKSVVEKLKRSNLSSETRTNAKNLLAKWKTALDFAKAEEQRRRLAAQVHAEILSDEDVAEQLARRDAQERARKEAEEQARLEAEEQARIEAEEEAAKQEAERRRKAAEEQARISAEEAARARRLEMQKKLKRATMKSKLVCIPNSRLEGQVKKAVTGASIDVNMRIPASWLEADKA